MDKYNEWWSSLTTKEKERIASKASGCVVNYPLCTSWWLEISNARKAAIYDHCVNRHGLEMGEWKEGDTFSY